MEDFFSLSDISSLCDVLVTSSFLIPLLVTILCVVGAYVIKIRYQATSGAADGSGNSCVVPESVNYHFTRECNYKCGFCFHTAKTSSLLPIEDAKRGLNLLKDAGECCCRLFVCLSVYLFASVSVFLSIFLFTTNLPLYPPVSFDLNVYSTA